MEIIALDIGTKRIGVARADSVARIPQALPLISVDGTEFYKIEQIIHELDSEIVIAGLPRSMSGQETKESERIRERITKLSEQLDKEIIFQDETLTSVGAQKIIEDSSNLFKKKNKDSLAAAIILQDYLKESFKDGTKE